MCCVRDPQSFFSPQAGMCLLLTSQPASALPWLLCAEHRREHPGSAVARLEVRRVQPLYPTLITDQYGRGPCPPRPKVFRTTQRGDRAPELAEITRRLIRIDSTNPPGNEHAAAAVLVAIAQEAGLHAELVPLGNGRSNATVRLPGDGSDPRRLLYCGHLDTVVTGRDPWKHHPLGADVIDGEIWGRGSVHEGRTGGHARCARCRTRTGTRLAGEVVLAATVGEEVDLRLGARHFLATGGMDGVAWLVVGEPTDLDLVIAHKGCLRFRVTTHGVASQAFAAGTRSQRSPCHGAAPTLAR